ncbi:MAG: S1 RNA-binding domain-containing protein, partial [Candidatus Kapaibacterium sp.]
VQAETTPETGKLEPEANIPADVESKEADIKTSEPVKPEEKQAQAKEEEAAKTEAAPEPAYDEQFEKLRQAEAEAKTVEVEVAGRIKGGLRVNFEGLPGFLPASHFSMRRNPAEEELQSAVGNTLEVNVHELQDENGRKTVIFSRKNRIEEDFWNNINPGEKVTGTVSSIASFGVFLDLGGVEGLIHISQLSQVHVNDPNDFATKGEDMEAVVVDVDREKKRIALSRKELEESPWKNISEEFPEGTSHQGIVRRLTDFGAYVELKPGVDGLLRTSELSWTKRIKSPSDVLKPNQQINVYIMNVNEEKQTMALSLKRTLPNPWESMAEKFPVGQETSGEVTQVMPQGAIVRLGDDEVDGFMPRSKMRSIMQGKKVPYEVGDKVDVKIVDLVPEQESLILAPIVDEETLAREQARQQQRRQREAPQQKQTHSSITLLDMLSEAEKKRLMENGGNE